MAEFAALGTICTYIGAAFSAYGKYEELFGPATPTVDWKALVDAAERRIISAVKQVEFREYSRRLESLGDWWNGSCVPFMRKCEQYQVAVRQNTAETSRTDPISPGNLEVFETKVGDRLDGNIQALNEAIKYFREDARGDYGTYGAILAAHSLNYILLTTKDIEHF
jgi:hypothetical protein